LTPTPPNWTDVVTAIGSAATGLGIVALGIGAFLTRKQVQEVVKTRQTEMSVVYATRWSELVPARQFALGKDSGEILLVFQSARENKTSQYWEFLHYLDFFEDLGALCKQDSVSLDWIKQTYASPIASAWERWSEAILWLRETTHVPTAYEALEELAKKLANSGA